MTWRFTKYLFRRPLIASGIVGISIHFLIELSSRLFLGRSYISHMMEDMREIPIYGVLRFLIPFFIPYVVTWISNRILVETATQSLIRFPQANPDVVMKLGPSGEVLFMNVAAVSTLERLGLGEGEVQQILPEDGFQYQRLLLTSERVSREFLLLIPQRKSVYDLNYFRDKLFSDVELDGIEGRGSGRVNG